MGAVILETRGLKVRYGRTLALDGVDVAVPEGEVLALLGANGAGKSTFVHALFGLVRPEGGEILLDGRPFRARSPADAARAGLGLVPQHDAVIDAFTVEENLRLAPAGAEDPRRRAEAAGLELPDGRAPASELSVGERQRIELARALAAGRRLLVLDEPTAALSPLESDRLLEEVRRLRALGVSQVLITHRLPEVFAAADRVVVLREGRVVLEGAVAERSQAELARAMVGEAASPSPRPAAAPGPVLLEIDGVSVPARPGRTGLHAASLEVREGEVLGVAGVAGNGQRALFELLLGLASPSSGTMRLGGRCYRPRHPGEARSLGVSVVPEDRRGEGLALPLSLAWNLHLSAPALAAVEGPFGLLAGRLRERAERSLARFGVRAAPESPAAALSGGNQQRLVLARELDHVPRLLLLHEPTRGLDLAAAAFVRDRVLERRDLGAGVLWMSTDLDELLECADRLVVLLRGRVVARFGRSPAREAVGRAMAEGSA